MQLADGMEIPNLQAKHIRFENKKDAHNPQFAITRKASGDDSNLQVFNSVIGKLGEVCAKILETTSTLTSPYFRCLNWIKDKIDPSDLARKRWIEKKTLSQIAIELGHGRTYVVRQIKQILENPNLISNRKLRKFIT